MIVLFPYIVRLDGECIHRHGSREEYGGRSHFQYETDFKT